MFFIFYKIYYQNSSLKLMGAKPPEWTEREGRKNLTSREWKLDINEFSMARDAWLPRIQISSSIPGGNSHVQMTSIKNVRPAGAGSWGYQVLNTERFPVAASSASNFKEVILSGLKTGST